MICCHVSPVVSSPSSRYGRAAEPWIRRTMSKVLGSRGRGLKLLWRRQKLKRTRRYCGIPRAMAHDIGQVNSPAGLTRTTLAAHAMADQTRNTGTCRLSVNGPFVREIPLICVRLISSGYLNNGKLVTKFKGHPKPDQSICLGKPPARCGRSGQRW